MIYISSAYVNIVRFIVNFGANRLWHALCSVLTFGYPRATIFLQCRRVLGKLREHQLGIAIFLDLRMKGQMTVPHRGGVL